MSKDTGSFNGAAFIRAVSHNWLGRFCAIAITFVVTPIVIHGLGDEAYGMWTMVISLGVYYGLSNLGLRAAGVKYIAQFESVEDRDAVKTVIVTMLATYFPLALLVLIVAVVLAAVFPSMVPSELGDSTVRTVIMLTAVSAAIGIVGQAFSAVLVAKKKFGQINVLSVTCQIVQATSIVTAVSFDYGLIAMAAIVLSVMVCQQTVTYFLAMRAAGHPQIRFRDYSKETLRLLLSFGALNVGVAASRKFMNYGGGLIVGVIAGPVMVAYYGVASNLVRKLEDLGKGVNSVLMPVVSELDARGEAEQMANAFQLASRSVLAIAIAVATVFIAIGQPLLTLWIDGKYGAASYPPLILLAIGMAIRLPRNAAANVLKGTARVSPLAKLGAIEAVVVMALGSALVYSSGMVGMAWAVVVTDAIFAVAILTLTCRTIGVTFVSYLRRVLTPGITAALPGVAVGLLLNTYAPPTRLFEVVAQALLICGVTGVAMIFVCLNAEIRSGLTARWALRRS